MFEVDYYKYTMYDANNPKDAPYGYIARTNFSFAGEVNRGAGYVRYMEADRVLMRASAMGGITPQGIFNDLSRSFRNGMLGSLIARKVPVGLSTRILFPVTVLLVPLWCRA